ncbi:cell division cycle protein 20 homolog B isoform X3 [Hemicordylus capensis]|uniref:cell division cycle protein 20 homolog B isoform X3 n=2 Tax=Hemicordylus capensis TaxID=884348 RepID=UPI002302B055|nr:cell division cycle protein 20 homolog B isoform X3 [Hemicordylus capensis]
MEWKLERSATRKVKTDEAVLWEKIMKALGSDLGRIRKQSVQMLPKETPAKTYSQFKSCIVKKLAFQSPVASSPITTRWQQRCRNQAEQTFPECRPTELSTSEDGSDLIGSAEKITTIPVSSKVFTEATANEPTIFTNTTHVQTKQKCLQQMSINEENRHGISEKFQGSIRICEKHECLWKGCKNGTKSESDAHDSSAHNKSSLSLEPEIRFHITGLQNDYYLNVLDWSHENLLALALGSAVHIWNGETNQTIESIDLCSTSKYIASVAWMRGHGCLAFGTSDGEIQLWDIETQKTLRNLSGHLSVVGVMSWNDYILSSGSRLGYICHHDIRSAQHHIGMARQSRQSVCSLQWSPDSRHLACGSSDGLLNIWPNDPGVTIRCRPLISIPHSSAVKAMMWCPWQSTVIATGGGMKDKLLHIWNISSMEILETVDAQSQVCSLLWLPNTKELVSGQGHPGNKMNIWKYPMLSNSAELCGHKGRVLHMALSPDGNSVFSAAADETAYVWKYRKI